MSTTVDIDLEYTRTALIECGKIPQETTSLNIVGQINTDIVLVTIWLSLLIATTFLLTK